MRPFSIWLLAVLVCSSASADGTRNVINRADAPNFIIGCPFSHRLPDDPIVYPGEPGASHSHDFFGNVSTDAYSTDESMKAAGTTCDLAADKAGYWMPTISQNGQVLEPRRVIVYYRNMFPDQKSLQTIPAGLEMIAGNHHDGEDDHLLPGKLTGWACRHPSGRKGSWTIHVPQCLDTEELVFRVQFPECSNGQLDSPDHRSHVARIQKNGLCPASHPIPIPRVSVTASFLSHGGPGITMSSGDETTGHMDFYNTWDQPVLDQLVEDCLRANKKCKFVAPGSDANPENAADAEDDD